MSHAQMETREILKFTRMCKYWQANRCTLGADCKFAHSELQLKSQPDLVGTQLCYQFTRKGVCKNGEACKFAHGRAELRRPEKRCRQPGKIPPRQPPSTINQEPDHVAPTSAMFAFRPPPGLERRAPAALPKVSMLNAEDSMLDPPATTPMGYILSSMHLPLTLEGFSKMSQEAEGTESASTAWLSGCLSDSEPASPMSGRFWL
ncbi:Zfp36 [Symbiodinium natans]|uniref:Zfp36 protein n=1 Tax=Symbiodinium natans TaxID=878477 RepID=A0A812PA75_9DINO|nr:Zfp36 [Symbiodinium natans]